MLTAQNLFFIIGLVCFIQLFFMSTGFLTLRTISKGSLSSLEELILSFVLGALSLGLLAISTLLFNLNIKSQSAVILLFLLLGISKNFKTIVFSIRENLAIMSTWVLYSTLAMITVLNPNLELERFTLADIQYHFGLPIDNLIPFQTVRYVTERISPNLVDPVPNWQFGNRGPFLGFSVSSFFLFLGLHEKSTWLNSSYPASFVFEAASIVFNSLCFVVAYSFSARNFGKKVASLTLALLLVNPFCYINIVFSWPKLFAAALGLFSLQLLLVGEFYLLLAAMILALGFLAHESIVFSILPLVIFVLFRFGYLRFLVFIGTFLLTLAPWAFYKIFWNQNSSKMFVHNVLCLKGKEDGSFYELLKYKINTDGLADFINVRLDNFNYPFDFTFINWSEKFSTIQGVLSIPQVLTDITFYQFIYAVGPILFLTFLILCVLKVKVKRSERDLTYVFIALFISSVAVSVFQGCVLSSWNHHWAYLPILVITIYTSKELVRGSPIFSIPIVLLQSSMNFAILYNYIWFPPRSDLRFVANSPREIAIMIIALLLVTVVFMQIFADKRRIKKF